MLRLAPRNNPALAALLAMLAAEPAHAEQPAAGDVYEVRPGESFRGWKLLSTGIGQDEQPFAVFGSANAYLLALTRHVTPATGTDRRAKKIIRLTRLSLRKGEETVDPYDCSFGKTTPALVFFNRRTRVARGFFAAKERISSKTWTASTMRNCEAYSD